MADERTTTRRRYFIEDERASPSAPDPGLAYLELLEIDEDADVARYGYELTAGASELWLGRAPGWASYQRVLDAAEEAAFTRLIEGGTFEIALSAVPHVVWLEVRSADLADSRVYRIETFGRRASDFRYTTLEDGDEMARGWLVENDDDDYSLTDDAGEATHGLIDTTGDADLEIVPIADLDGTARLVLTSDDTYRAYLGSA